LRTRALFLLALYSTGQKGIALLTFPVSDLK
jgi:hypothetical protein